MARLAEWRLDDVFASRVLPKSMLLQADVLVEEGGAGSYC